MPKIFQQIKLLIQYRHLIFDLAVKDIKIRYRNPVLGFLWSILIPLVTVLIFKFIFSTILQVKVERYPFFIYLITAVFPWAYFTSAVSASTESIHANRDLIKKTYFPRQIIPVSVVLAHLLNFLPTLGVMFLILIFFQMPLTGWILLLPVIILLQTMLAVGLALIFSSLQVILRDVKYIVELLLMAWMYLSPVFYPLALVENLPPWFFKLYLLNPFVGLFSLYRAALLKGYLDSLPAQVNIYYLVFWPTAVCLGVFLLGFTVFNKYEKLFSDLV